MLTRWLPRVAALALGVLLAMSMPRPAWWWLGWVGIAPIIVVVARSDTAGEALLRSWLGGTGYLLTLHYWLVPHMGVFTIPVAAFAGLFWLPLGGAVWFSLRREVLDTARPLWGLAVIPGVWLAIEGVRSWEYLAGSWGLVGLTQWQVDPVLQAAALGGVWLLSLILVVTNTGLAIAALTDVPRSHRRAGLAVAVLVPLATIAFGVTRGDAPVEGHVTIAGIQPGVIDDDRERFEAHVELTEELAGSDVDMVVWGQSSVGFDPDRQEWVDEALREVSAQVGADVLVNVDARVAEGRISKVFVHYTPDGPVDSYAKQRLVPFGEYIPLRPLFGWVAGVTEAAQQDRARGQDLKTIPVDGVAVGPLISYESTFPDMRRRLAQLGADVTVVQGGTWTFQGTWAQPQQATHEAVRAVASGRPAILVAVSGTSAAFDARGRQLEWRPADWTGSYVVDIPLSQEETPFVRFGPWPLWLAWGATAATVAVAAVGRIRR